MRSLLLGTTPRALERCRASVVSRGFPVRAMCKVSTDVNKDAGGNSVPKQAKKPKPPKKRHFQAITLSELHPKAGYAEDDVTDVEAFQVSIDHMKNEFSKWKHEWIYKLDGDILLVRPGDRDIVWKFDTSVKSTRSSGFRSNPWDYGCFINPLSPQHAVHDVKCTGSLWDSWISTSDSDHDEGYSVCSFVGSAAGHGLFIGNLDTKVAQEGIIDYTGYCNIISQRPKRSFNRELFFDWADYTHLVIRCRGDGRSYMVNLGQSGYYDLTWNNAYHHPLYTRGGPHWQTMKIPFSRFYHANRGVIQDKQAAVMLEKITSFGITCGDKNSGPFKLEIDYIALENDPLHEEEFAYELYHVDHINH